MGWWLALAGWIVGMVILDRVLRWWRFRERILRRLRQWDSDLF